MPQTNHFPSLRIEGGLFSPDLFEALTAADLPGQKPQDFNLPARRSLTDEIAAAFNDARALWGVFQHRLARLSESDLATSLTRDAWAIPFLGLLGYELRYNPRAYEVDGLTFAISHRAGEDENAPPVHIVGTRQELGRLAPSGRPRLSPHALMQEYLNRSEALWGLVTNGRTLRLLRDSTFVRRQAYVEFDLEAIFAEERFADFVILYRLLHRTRLPAEQGEARECLLEKYYSLSVEQGGRVREHLREGVEECLKRLANGFLRHPRSEDLRTWVRGETEALPLYRELLRLVYRFLFLLVSEERGLISDHPLYLEHYGVTRLRRLVEQRAAFTDDVDLWHSLRVLWVALTDEKMGSFLRLPPLNGELFAHLHLDDASITNRDLLDAFWHLAYYQENRSAPRRVNYAALDTEELGSVYESLLEFHPHIEWQGHTPHFDMVELGGERRSTGSHYTPPELVAPLIQSTLEPVLTERLKTAKTSEEKEAVILSIKVCDPACGSGHFLLAAARRLGKELARVRTGEDEPAPDYLHQAVRDVITHCVYGVDKNPLAVELCRVALWLEGHAKGKPLTFLKHHIRCGDSLAGLTGLEKLEAGIPDEAYKPLAGDDRAAARQAKTRNAREREAALFRHAYATRHVQRFAEELSKLNRLPEDTIEQVRAKAEAYSKIETSAEFHNLRLACDTWMTAFFQSYPPSPPSPPSVGEGGEVITTAAVQDALSRGIVDARQGGFVFQTSLEKRFFHWALDFPEVFAAGEHPETLGGEGSYGGFDVILGNPPFLGGKKLSTVFGNRYRQWLNIAYGPFTNTADLCAAFYRRAFHLLRSGGRMGMVATNTIGQGDTRESGLAVIVKEGGSIIFAKRFVKWPGQANVEVNLIALRKGTPPGALILDEHVVDFISSRLDDQPEAETKRLGQNEGKAFIGDFVRGIGFVLEPKEAKQLTANEPRNADCLFPYLNGEDLNSYPDQRPSRWIICFHDWNLDRAKQYPQLINIVQNKVKPEREHLTGPGDRLHREKWWQFANYRPGLRIAIASLQRVLVRSRVSELHSLIFVPKGLIYSDQVIVFAYDDNYHFALLQSNMHEVWVWRQASSLESRNRYTPTDCFDTFPFPPAEYAEEDLNALLHQPAFAEAARLGAEYLERRRQTMLARQLGLTRTYTLFHNPEITDGDIVHLRELHAEMDRAILACYGWQDLDLRHGFYQNDRGQTRFTVSPQARRELLRRLVELNAEIAKKERAPGE